MSNEAITWAFKTEGLTMTEKFVLIALADYADDNHTCFPSHAKTAKRICASKSTVQRAVKSLHDKGYLEIISWARNNGSTTTNRYRLRVGSQFDHPSQSDYPHGHSDHGGSHCDTRAGYVSDQGAMVTGDHPLTLSKNPQYEPPLNTAPAKRGADTYTPAFLQWWEHYPRKQDKGAAFKAWRKIKDVDLDTLIEAADRYAADPNRVDQYTKHPATWLNARAWEDETPLPARRQSWRMDSNERADAAIRQMSGVVNPGTEDLMQRAIGGGW